MKYLYLFTVLFINVLAIFVDAQEESVMVHGRLEGKVALITGAAQGIGKETAIVLAREGAKVIVSDINDEKGKLVAEEIGKSSLYVHLDVRSESDWKAAMNLIGNTFSKLDILVNNAAIVGIHREEQLDPEHISLERCREIQAVNFEGVLLGCKYAIQTMKNTTNKGSIINISSIAALVGYPDSPIYAATKTAVINLTKSVAMYCCREGYPIRCNVVLPGFIHTNMLYETEEQKDRVQAFLKNTPIKEIGTPSDIAHAILFLASDESQYINASELVVDGGMIESAATKRR